MRHANRRFGPVRAAKCDVKDGYHRMFLNALQCLRLAILLPKFEGEEQLMAVPLAITMGWVQSSPTFCVMSETVCDVTNASYNKAPFAGTKHRLESMAATNDDLSSSMEPRPFLPEDLEADARL